MSRGVWRLLASAVVVIMLASLLGYAYLDWQAEHQIMRVRVVDIRSGTVTEYLAAQGEIGDQSLVTVDGRQIRLAQTERMEISPASEAEAADHLR